MHQHGFERYAALTLECGHKTRAVYYEARDRDWPYGRPVKASTFPEAGSWWCCPKCRAENLDAVVPLFGGRRSAARTQTMLGMEADEFYELALADPQFNEAASRLSGEVIWTAAEAAEHS